MPYIAKTSNNQINSLSLSDNEFALLKNTEVLCIGCGQRMFTKRSKAPLRTPHFAHYRKTEYCPTSNMSDKHLAIQALIDKAVNDVDGWRAVTEYQGGDWRGDVVAINDSKHRMISFEVQISPMSYDKAQERIDKHKASGVEQVIWILGRKFYWESAVSGASFATEKAWDPMKGVDVTYRNLQDPYREYVKEDDYITRPIDSFLYDILSDRIAPKYEEGIAITESGGLTWTYEEFFNDQVCLFETAEQIKEATNEKAYKEAREDHSRRNAEYWDSYYAEQKEDKRLEQEKIKDNIEKWNQKKRAVKAFLADAIPGIDFDDYKYKSTAEGDVAICPGGQYLIIQPVRKRINMMYARALVYDQRIPIIFMYESEKIRLQYKFPNRANIYCLSDLNNPSSVSEIQTVQTRFPRPFIHAFRLY